MLKHKLNPIYRLQLVVETYGMDTPFNKPTNENSLKVPKVVIIKL